MQQILANTEWARRVVFDPHGRPWHTSAGGNNLPVIVTARAELRDLGSGPAFSITGEVFNPRARRGNSDGVIMGGCIHEVIAHYFPSTLPLITVHLSDEDGTPMHAAANAAYWAGLTKYQAADVAALARHLHIAEPLAVDLMEWVHNFYGDNPDAYDAVTTPADAMRAAFTEFDLPTVWAGQAAAARALLRATV